MVKQHRAPILCACLTCKCHNCVCPPGSCECQYCEVDCNLQENEAASVEPESAPSQLLEPHTLLEVITTPTASQPHGPLDATPAPQPKEVLTSDEQKASPGYPPATQVALFSEVECSMTDPLTDQGQFTTQEVFNGMADFAQNGPTHQARAEAEAAAAALPTPSRSGSGSPFRPSRARWLATDATGQIQPTAADAAHHDALPAAAAAAEAAGHPAWVIEWMAADAALHAEAPTAADATAAQWRAAEAALQDEAPTAADANLGTTPDRIRVPICPSVFPHDTRHQADEAAQAAQAAQDPPTRYYALYEEPLRHPMAQWLADVCAPHGQFPKISRSQDDWVVRWLIRFDTRIEAETTEAFRIQAAAVAAICRRWPSAETQAAAIAAAAEEAGLPDWVHDWLAEYEARLIGWETPSWLVRWLQASIWQYAERRAARIRERLRAIAKATSSSSSSSRPA